MKRHKDCAERCQCAQDVCMPEYSCVGVCQHVGKPGAFRNFAVARDAFVRALKVLVGIRVRPPTWFLHEKHPDECTPSNCDLPGDEWAARRDPKICPRCGGAWAADIEFDAGKARECMRCGHWGFL